MEESSKLTFCNHQDINLCHLLNSEHPVIITSKSLDNIASHSKIIPKTEKVTTSQHQQRLRKTPLFFSHFSDMSCVRNGIQGYRRARKRVENDEICNTTVGEALFLPENKPQTL